MKRILVATDFSSRSDRAIRRATLLAKKHEASLTIVHVVDDDQPRRILEAEKAAASELLEQLAASLRDIDRVDCDWKVTLGDPYQGIINASEDLAANLVIIGAHRRQELKDVFVGTTAERTIRGAHAATLMANAVPADVYHRILIAVDFSDCSRGAVEAVKSLELDKDAAVSVINVFDAIGTGPMLRSAMTREQIDDYVADEKARAANELSTFVKELHVGSAPRILKLNTSSVAREIQTAAKDIQADLIVVGTSGRTGLAKVLLGSAAEELLRITDRDVLAVPPHRH